MSAAKLADAVMTDGATSPTRWVTAEVLRTLTTSHAHRPGDRFNGQWLTDATPTLNHIQRSNAVARLLSLSFIKRVQPIVGDAMLNWFEITADGAAAIKAAAEGHVRKSGPKTTRAPNPVRGSDLTTRLWGLMRVRKILDSDAAARTLCDAGEAEFERVRATVRKTLRRWELAGNLVAGAKRVKADGQPITSNGAKRYVLVKDCGPTPPRWTAAIKAANLASTAEAQSKAAP